MADIEKQIIDVLSHEQTYIKSTELAMKLDVSSKTIYRAIKKINEKEKIIESKRGLGYFLRDYFDKDESQQEEFLNDRVYSIGIYILFSQPTSLRFLETANKFYISEPVLTTEIKKINILLKSFSVEISRKKGLLYVAGNEINIRQALNFFLIRKGDLNQNFELVSKVFPSIAKKDKEFLISQIILIQEELKVTVADPYSLNIFSHLYIMMERIRFYPQKEENINPNSFEYSGDEKFYIVSRSIIGNISQYLGIPINTSEIIFLAQYLQSLRYVSDSYSGNNISGQMSDKYDLHVINFANFIIDNYPLTRTVNKTKLLEDLCAHIKPMLNRIVNKLTIINPLATEIKETYKKQFSFLSKLVNQYTLENYKTKVSDDEIGFLTIYIVRAMEESIQPKKVLLMCSSGIGTAKLIQTKLSKALPNINIIDSISSYSYLNDIEKYNHKADLIVSTVAIPDESEVPIVLVSPLLNELDLRRIRMFLND